ncbi:MAG: hypothetical protein G01um101425_43 [Candidatus Peregrinibacteria bacterium Gr01-1014_25]|nr:MAG: hypothetical protein G01um101425_43 [Candidatus Peregrinibacteria bacterium Gr01-1014_25]
MTGLRRFWPMLPVITALLLFAPAVTFESVRWDDPQLVFENPRVTAFSPSIWWTYDPELYVPLTLTTYQIEYALVGPQPWLFHLTNILLHALNAALVFLLLKRLTGSQSAAAIAAALFAAHPLTIEAVAWISGRKELLWAAFALCSMLLYARTDARHVRTLLPSIGCMILATLAKPTALVIPFLLLTIDAATGRRIDQRVAVEKWPYVIVSIITGVIAFLGKEHAVGMLGPLDTLLLALRSVAHTAQHALAPIGLSTLYPVDPSGIRSAPALLAGAAVLLLAGAAWILRRRATLLGAGITFFLIALAPSLLAYQRSNEVALAADRYAYVPLVGLALVAAWGFTWMESRGKRAIVWIFGALAIALLAACTTLHLPVWHDTETLFRAALKTAPTSIVAKNNLAFRLLADGKLAEAEVLLSEALTANPRYADALVNLAAIRGRQGRLDEAESLLLQALSINPKHVNAHINLGGVALKHGDRLRARAEYEAALALQPGNPHALRLLQQME